LVYCSSLGGNGGGPLLGFKNLNAIRNQKIFVFGAVY
jgi:hypothetical protein